MNEVKRINLSCNKINHSLIYIKFKRKHTDTYFMCCIRGNINSRMIADNAWFVLMCYAIFQFHLNDFMSIHRNKASSKDLKYERPDSYLIPKEPGRSGPPAKISERTNIHILVEFGLQV